MIHSKLYRGKRMSEFNKLFYDLNEPTAFSSSLPIRYASRKPGRTIDKYLKTQETWTRHKAIRHRFPRRRTTGVAVFSHVQGDLVQMENPGSNRNHKMCLTMIDCYSRYAFAIPIKNKTAGEVARSLQECFNEHRMWPTVFITDAGKEFVNSEVRELFRLRHVTHVVTNSLLKATMVERFNRTLQNRLYKLMFYEKTKNWIDTLPSVTDAVNKSYHRGIRPTPFKAFYGLREPNIHDYNHFKKPKRANYRMGDKVRLSKTRGTFQRGYKSGWTERKFAICEVCPPIDEKAEPWSYRVLDLSTGEIVPGRVYEHEIVNAILFIG